MKIRRLISIIITILFFTFIWLGQNSKYLNHSTFESLLMMNNTAFGYNSMMAYFLLYTFPFFIFNYYVFLPDNQLTIVRRLKRKNLYNTILFRNICTAFAFSFIHMLINISLTYLFQNSDLLKDTNFLFINFMNMIALFFYFLWIGIIGQLIYDLFHSLFLANFTTYFFIGVFYFLEKLVISERIWDPLKDLTVFQHLLEQKWSYIDLIFVYFREIFVVLILYLIGSSVFLRKDIFSRG